jgi:hypothetical protein
VPGRNYFSVKFGNWILSLLVGLWPAAGFALIEGGVGLNSVTSGRLVPSATLGINGESWALSGAITGVRNYYYYHSAYSLNFFVLWNAGELGWGPVQTGLGGGVMYAEKGFQDDGAAKLEKQSDFVAGPSFRVRWFAAGPVFVNFDVLWGLRELGVHLMLSGQDVVVFSVGASL